MGPRQLAVDLLIQRRAFLPGSPDWDWRTRAAWKLDQMQRGIPPRQWTDAPPQGLSGPCRLDVFIQEIAA